MTQTDWRMKGIEFGACNCNWGCPCQFNELPSLGHCTGGMVMKLEDSWFGSTRLDGLVWGMCCEWPGAVHQGNGKMLVYAEERATPAQRQAIVDIVHGKHSAEGSFFNIFSAVCPTKLPPIFAPIEFTLDPAARTARVTVKGVFDMVGEPIRNPVTGDAHYPRVVLPNGFEFKEAEFGSCTITSSGPIALNRERGHAHFASVQWGPQGYIG